MKTNKFYFGAFVFFLLICLFFFFFGVARAQAQIDSHYNLVALNHLVHQTALNADVNGPHLGLDAKNNHLLNDHVSANGLGLLHVGANQNDEGLLQASLGHNTHLLLHNHLNVNHLGLLHLG